MNNIRRALRGFVDTGLLPTDLVAIVRTGESRGILQSLTNDRGALQAAIDALRYTTQSRKGVSPSGDVVQLGPGTPEVDEMSSLQRSVSTAGSLAALNLVVQAARDLPGRKTVIFASEGFQLAVGTDGTTIPDVDPRVRAGVNRVVDQATRSGVVIYAIDGQALQPAGLRASDDIHSIDTQQNPDAMAGVVRGIGAASAMNCSRQKRRCPISSVGRAIRASKVRARTRSQRHAEISRRRLNRPPRCTSPARRGSTSSNDGLSN
jgi:VWFA-related protein